MVWALYMADISNGLSSFARIQQAFTIFLYFTLFANGLCTCEQHPPPTQVRS